MTRRFAIALLLTLCAIAPQAMAQFVVRVGDIVYVDGTKYSWEEWKKVRDKVGTDAPAPATSAAGGDEPLAASCVSSVYYDEFPSEDERFQCSSGLGALTRQELLRRGWKVDLIEKIPPPAGKPSASVRGLPLNLYKLVISRPGAPHAQPAEPAKPQPATARARAQRLLDTQCLQDCMGTGGTRPFCEDRCTN
jgi:hypothetical protein